MNSAVLDCARYGEMEDLQKLVEAGASVNFQGPGGLTPLHAACANGYLDIVKYLVEKKVNYLPNASGNFPLHWAVLNQQVAMVQYLCKSKYFCDLIDVFAPNSFGKTAVSEGFDSGNADILIALLNHKSAEEHNQKQKAKKEAQLNCIKKDKNENEIDPSAGTVQKIHTMVFQRGNSRTSGPSIKIREIVSLVAQWNNDLVFDECGKEDSTGMWVWPASIILARYITKYHKIFIGKNVCELGSGCGLPSLVCAQYTDCLSPIIATDYCVNTIENLKDNIKLNFSDDDRIHVQTTDWGNKQTWPKKPLVPPTSSLEDIETIKKNEDKGFDIIIGSDLIYQKTLVAPLVNIVDSLLNQKGIFFYVARQERGGLVEFADAMKDKGFFLHSERVGRHFFKSPLLAKKKLLRRIPFIKSRTQLLFLFLH